MVPERGSITGYTRSMCYKATLAKVAPTCATLSMPGASRCSEFCDDPRDCGANLEACRVIQEESRGFDIHTIVLTSRHGRLHDCDCVVTTMQLGETFARVLVTLHNTINFGTYGTPYTRTRIHILHLYPSYADRYTDTRTRSR